MRYSFLFIYLVCLSCNDKNTGAANNTAGDSTGIASIPAVISTTRNTVSTKPVAEFTKKVDDALNDWKFSVSIYETRDRFHFLMKMQYMELRETDTLKIPNLGSEPTIEIKPGEGKYACIIGFLDKKNTFKPYKLVTAKDDRLSVKVLQRYAVTAAPAK